MAHYFIDQFGDDQLPGEVIGRRNADGVVRQGIDTEKVVSIDHGALRIRPLLNPGWGRAGLAYGPYKRENGLLLAVSLLNGHNTSQTGGLMVGLPNRLGRWFLGSPGTDSIWRRVRGLIANRYKSKILRQIYRWIRIARQGKKMSVLNENLTLGWFSCAVPTEPLLEGNTFAIHAAGPRNGELWARIGADFAIAIDSLQNVQMYYVIVLRETGAAYYAASVEGAYGAAAYPYLRPVAIDPFNNDREVYAVLQQSVQGQIGFRVDTRVYEVQVQKMSRLAQWYGTAVIADRLTGEGLLQRTGTETGEAWQIIRGQFVRTAQGLQATGDDNLAILDAGVQIGLIHLLAETAVPPQGEWRLLWRLQDRANYWQLSLSTDSCQLAIIQNGINTLVAEDELPPSLAGALNSVQIIDERLRFAVYVNGRLLFDTPFQDARLQEATHLGLHVPQAHEQLFLRALEGHPRQVCLQPALKMKEPWQHCGQHTVIFDDFAQGAGDLAGSMTTIGQVTWRRDQGQGTIELTEKGNAKVRATQKRPNPNRTIYTVPWIDPGFADVQVEITPPGTERGQWELGRAGVVFRQDKDNYLIISNWLDDHYDGASLSSFFYLDGFEDLYDAVWTNVAERVYWGRTHTLRVVCDGLNYMAFVNGEPVLYRSLTDVYPDFGRLAIYRVGLVANWEWGNDTGTTFTNFEVKAR